MRTQTFLTQKKRIYRICQDIQDFLKKFYLRKSL
jgi:hypothetical protein